MPSFLVTGADGQLGQCFQAVAQEFPEQNLIFTQKAEADITVPKSYDNIYQKRPFDGIINCAAYTQVDKAEDEPLLAHRINVGGIKNIIDFAQEKALSVIHFSTDYVFDGLSTKSYKEDSIIQPINTYGSSKFQGEEIIKMASCPHIIIRLSWLFSPFGKNFVKTILKLSEVRKTIQVVNDQYGRPTYGIDLARIVLSNISKPDFFDFNSYNYAMQGTTTWFDFASKIIAIKKSTCQIKSCSTAEYPTLAKRPKHSVLDTKRIENHLSLNIPSWEDSLKRCLKRIDKNEKI
jgi:dTDP-4-dehydrorhamnose reductase